MRRPGGGRRPLSANDPTLVADLERLVDGGGRGDPELPLRWTAKSVRRLSDGLRQLGHRASHETVARLLRRLGYSLQANEKVRDGRQPPTATRSWISDLTDDTGWVNLGIDHDTAGSRSPRSAAGGSTWGARYPAATTLTITADCGGSNGNRTRLWKTELQRPGR